MALSVYKKGQGTAARGVAAVLAGSLAAWGSYMMWFTVFDWPSVLRTLMTALVAFIFGGLPVYLALFNRHAVDILIETQQEMRKVAWSSRSEVTTSTVVVVFTVVFLAMFILVTDYVVYGLLVLFRLY
jgi:preprotein translocase SecE subunit